MLLQAQVDDVGVIALPTADCVVCAAVGTGTAIEMERSSVLLVCFCLLVACCVRG